MVEIQDVSFAYEKKQGTLFSIDLQIGQGECVLLCGESGCGKTTVTKLVNGLIPHFVEGGALSGRALVNGMEVAGTEMYRLAEQVGSVFQNPKSQFFNIDSDSEITFGLENAGIHPDKIKERLEATVSALKIGPPGTKNGLSVESLSCAFDRQTVFEGISFSAVPGEVLGIVGNNGAGKTTLTRCLCGLLKEEGGTVRLDGKTLNRKQRNRACSLVMQDVNHQLFSDSVWNECELSMPECRAEEIEKILKAFELLEFKERHPMALSGGQKQRLAVATAILSGKRLLVFDEPTSGLDYRHMLEVGRMIRELAGQGCIVLVVSHDREFMEKACDRIFEMD